MPATTDSPERMEKPMLEKIPSTAARHVDVYGAARRVQASEQSRKTFSVASPKVPSSPPAEVLAALDGVARVEAQLSQRGLRVSYDVEPRGEVRVSVVNADGAVVRRLGPADALEVLSDASRVAEIAA
jgi:hypothetical protein